MLNAGAAPRNTPRPERRPPVPGAFDGIFPIGLGTGRFPFAGPETFDADFENAVNLVLYALNRGVNYIDVGRGYSDGKAFSVLKEAFSRTDKECNVTVKVNCYDEHSSDEYRREAESCLSETGLGKASHFLLWTLMDEKMFRRAVQKGGLYDAALKLRADGLIKHIGASLHMRPDEIVKVIESGLFEFVLVSYNLLNFFEMQTVLDRAAEKNVDVAVMNPLCGGLIPRNESMFAFAKLGQDETLVRAAVRAVLAHPAVKCVLAGAGSARELDEYLAAADCPDDGATDGAARIEALKKHVTRNKKFCSYCKYCADCPKGIPVPQIMSARNMLALADSGGTDQSEKLFFRSLRERFDVDFDSSENPCVKCGQCEAKCTQHLNITESLDEVYGIVAKTCYDRVSRGKRFDGLINGRGYKKVGFWPASAGTMRVLDVYKDIFGEIPFETELFDSNADFHGKEKFGHIVRAKDEAARLGVDCILITSFAHRDAIRESIRDLEADGTAVKVLYKPGDADWWW
jgi:predicted aldo/keto reductase-like oxidoreductase